MLKILKTTSRYLLMVAISGVFSFFGGVFADIHGMPKKTPLAEQGNEAHAQWFADADQEIQPDKKELRTLSTSPLYFNWNSKLKSFEFQFYLQNSGKTRSDINALLVIEDDYENKRWRGFKAPPIAENTTALLAFILPGSFLLQDFHSTMEIKIYSEKFKQFHDKSSTYQKLIVQYDEKTGQIKVHDKLLNKKNETGRNPEQRIVKFQVKAPKQMLLSFKKSRKARAESVVLLKQEPVKAPIRIFASAKAAPMMAAPIDAVMSDAPVLELLEKIRLDNFRGIEPEEKLLMDIRNTKLAEKRMLNKAKELENIGIEEKNQLIALYVAEGNAESIANVLSEQLRKEPKNLNLSLTLSKVYQEKGDIKAALSVLTSSLNRISLSARVSMGQSLKLSSKRKKSAVSNKTEEAYLAGEFKTLALELLKKEKFADALSALESLRSLDPDSKLLLFYLASSRSGLKQHQQAKRLFLKQSDLEISQRELLLTLGRMTRELEYSPDFLNIKATQKKFALLKKEYSLDKIPKEIGEYEGRLEKLLRLLQKQELESLADLALTLKKVKTSPTLIPGGSIQVHYAIANIGGQPSSDFRLFYQLEDSKGIRYDISDQDRFKPLKNKAPPIHWKKSLLLPAQLLPDQYKLVSFIEHLGDKMETSQKNNVAISQESFTVNPLQVDLAVRFGNSPRPLVVSPGQEISVQMERENRGSLDSSEPKIYYAIQFEDGTNIEISKPEKLPPIDKRSGIIKWESSILLPEIVKEGKVQLVARIDSSDASEVQFENNQDQSGYRLNFIKPYTELGIDLADTLKLRKVKGKDALTVPLMIHNKGTKKSQSVEVFYFLRSAQNTIPLPTSSTIDTVPENTTALKLMAKFKLPPTIPAGKYKFIAQLVPSDQESERDFSNHKIISENVVFEVLKTSLQKQALKITSIFPGKNEEEVATKASIEAIFNIVLDSEKNKGQLIQVEADGQLLEGEVQIIRKTLKFTPTNALLHGKNYKVRIRSGLISRSGETLVDAVSWTFATLNEESE